MQSLQIALPSGTNLFGSSMSDPHAPQLSVVVNVSDMVIALLIAILRHHRDPGAWPVVDRT